MGRQRYKNYDGIENTTTFRDMIRWNRERRGKQKDLTTQIPHAIHKDINRIQKNRTDFSITWIGHSTFLIQMGGLNILTDPVWSRRMGVQKRLTEPGLSIKELPEIDIVLISHGHYDHLDFSSIKKLKGAPNYYIPIGLKSAFRRRGYENVIEANWWESFHFNNIKLSFVPAQHWTKRSLTDTNTSHWGGWVIENLEIEAESIYFVGDTGYFRVFKEIGSSFNLNFILMPIGAYEPEWFMATSHINPEDSIQAFLELKGKQFIPMHYGAYRLADDTGPEALERLLVHWENQQLNKEMLKVLAIGETLWK